VDTRWSFRLDCEGDTGPPAGDGGLAKETPGGAYTLPSFTGNPLKEVTQWLEDNGLEVGFKPGSPAPSKKLAGTVEAQDNPLPGTYAMKFYEVTKQISLTKHIIDVKLLCVTNSVWDQMTDQQKQWMREAAAYACAEGSKTTYKQEEELLDFFKDYGMIITYPDVAAFQKYSFDYYQKNGLTKDWNMDLYNRVQALK